MGLLLQSLTRKSGDGCLDETLLLAQHPQRLQGGAPKRKGQQQVPALGQSSGDPG